jgi:hypothetical protein
MHLLSIIFSLCFIQKLKSYNQSQTNVTRSKIEEHIFIVEEYKLCSLKN